jgi:hypothetical protein
VEAQEARVSADGPVDVGIVTETLERLILRAGKPVVLVVEDTSEPVEISPAVAAAPDGLLPVFLVAAEAIWRECMGYGFGLQIVRDDHGLLGYRVGAITTGLFSGVMLSIMEVISQSISSGRIVVNRMDLVWRSALQRIELAVSQSDGRAEGGVA